MSVSPYRTNSMRDSRRRLGTTTVEFALTAPFLFMLLFGALELSRMNMIRETANNAAYEAARTCIVPGATNGEGVSAANAVLRSIGVVNASVQVQPSTITDKTPSVTATVTIPYQGNMWVIPHFSKNRSASVTCSLERDWVVSTRSQ